VDSSQLSLDFFAVEAAFDHTLEDVEKLNAEIAQDIKGNENADNENAATGSRSQGSDTRLDHGAQARQLRSAGMESGGSLGLFDADAAGSVGSEGTDSAAGRNQPASSSRAHVAGVGERPAADDDRGGVPPAGGYRAPAAGLNYAISSADEIGAGGPKTKFKANLSALELLNRLAEEGRQATQQEQSVLVKYVGWGGLPQAFDPANADWQSEYEALSTTLSAEAFDAARRSTQDAHYTPPEVIAGIYDVLEQFGFRGGRILDAAVGTGNFIGVMPEEIRASSKVTGIELDPTTAAIAKHLYPEATIIQRGFQDVMIPDGYFDAAVGNPPFGNQRVFDEVHQDLSRHSIHNYFLAKSLAKVAPGGVSAFVVSSYFLDAAGTDAREQIAASSHFLGAVRLPSSTFKQIANTEVTTDVVFFQKARDGQEIDTSWTTLGEMTLEDGAVVPINSYYTRRPDMVLGKLEMDRGQHGREILTVADSGISLESTFARAAKTLPRNIYTAPDRATEVQNSNIDVPSEAKVGAYFVTSDGRIAMRLPDQLDRKDAKYAEFRSQRAGERVRGMITVRDAVTALMQAEQQDLAPETLDSMRQRLNTAYDGFVKRYGHLSSQANRLAMSDDPEYPLLQALERDYDKGISTEIAERDGSEPRAPSAAKAAIFTRRVCSPRRMIESVESAKEALVVSMNERGAVDWTLMRRLYGKSVDEMVAELDGLVFQDPIEKERWFTRDQYLSGNVKEKLRVAESALAESPMMEKNVRALRAVIPKDIEPIDIAVQLGSAWVPPAVVEEFVGQLLGNVSCSISYQPSLGKWVTKIATGDPTVFTVQWGTKEAPANQLIESILANRPIQVRDMIGHDDANRPIYRLNAEKTAVAGMKADEIRQAFADWIWEDPERRRSLAAIYNERFNTHVAPTYDGSHLTLPGASLAVELRPSQKNFIWRSIQDGNSLADHEVGAGKTFALCGVAMESRRMGLVRKPMLVVPNHLLLPWKDAFNTLYPDANVLVAEKEDFEKKNRQKLFARIATGDWDAVIIAHSSLKKIGMPEHTLQAILNEQIDDLSDAIVALKQENGDRVAIKEMEKIKDRMKAKLERASETGSKDQVVTFDQLGVDALLVDEADEFKNLYIATSMSRVAGLGNLQGSEKAFDLFVKCRYIHETFDKRGLTFATGTPVANSIAEVYTLQRYLQYDELKSRGIVHFDAWASTFGKVVTGWELDATGVNYKMNSRFSKFQNVPELASMYRSFADVITNADLKAQAQSIGKRFPLPNIKGGKPQNIVVERSPEQARFMGVRDVVTDEKGLPLLNEDGRPVTNWNPGSIIYRMEHMPTDPRLDNPLKVTNDARKAGLDFRLIDDSADDFEGSKVNQMIDRAVDLYHRWDKQKGTQLIFCDLSTPKAASKTNDSVSVRSASGDDEEEEGPVISMDELLSASNKGRFSVYQDVKDKLIARGIPAGEIAFIHDAKTDAQLAKLYDQMNRGEKRFCLGSTTKMGAGTNVQRLLVGLHNLDCPWRPRDLTQRLGRIIRQGNALFEADPDGFEVEIFNYSTKQTYDARMWQTIEYKAAAIEQFRRGDMIARVIDDVTSEAANAAEMKAAATGNHLIFAQVQIQSELKKIEAAHANYKRNLHALDHKVSSLTGIEDHIDERVKKLQADIDRRNAAPSKQLVTKSGVLDFEEQKEALTKWTMDVVAKAISDRPSSSYAEHRPATLGEYRGFTVRAYCQAATRGKESSDMLWFELSGATTHSPNNLIYDARDKFSINGLFQRLDNALAALDGEVVATKERLVASVAEREGAKAERLKPFAQEQYLSDLRADMAEVMVELQRQQDDEKFKSRWKPRTIEIAGAGTKGDDLAEVVLEPEAVIRAEAKLVKLDYLDSAFHPKRAAEIFQQTRHQCLAANSEIHAAVLGEIGDDEAFAKAIVDNHQATPATAMMQEAAARCIADRAAIKAYSRESKLTVLNARSDSGEHSGPILHVVGDYALQDGGRGVAILHRISRIDPEDERPVVGKQLRIAYSKGSARVTAATERLEAISR